NAGAPIATVSAKRAGARRRMYLAVNTGTLPGCKRWSVRIAGGASRTETCAVCYTSGQRGCKEKKFWLMQGDGIEIPVCLTAKVPAPGEPAGNLYRSARPATRP